MATAEPSPLPPPSPSPSLSLSATTLASDPKFRKYSQLVDKTLASFDNVNEWADFITFLACVFTLLLSMSEAHSEWEATSKLLKCLQGYPQFPVIPHKLTVAKRLSQCLNPALPTGVHQRALDVYTHILTAIGPENLKRDLPAWSSGLFPFFQYAATSVKPIVLGIYERFYLPLQESLRPATKAFILALLPGLEEETGEFFEKVAALLDRVSGTVSPSFFFQNIWLVLITAPNSRIPALNYLARRLPKMDTDDSVSHIVGKDVGLMVRGFAAALEDPQILVQRGILDLLTSTLKLDSVGFRSTRRDDQILLMRAVMGVVLRRDLSLSRRLYAWLLGPADSSTAQIAYLKQHGLELLRSALKAEMDAQSSEMLDRQRPFKIFISLLDKWEIGGPLTEVLVLDAFAALRAALRPDDDHDELLLTGNMLFEIIDPFLMWKQIYHAVCESVEVASESDEAIELARFVVHTFRLHDEEVQKLHAPFVAFGILDLVESTCRISGPSRRLTSAIALATELLPEIAFKFFESTPPADGTVPSSSTLDHAPGHALARALYAASDMKTASLPETEGRELLAHGLVASLRLAELCAVVSPRVKDGDDLLVAAVGVVVALAGATAHAGEDLVLDWRPDEWADRMVGCLEATKAENRMWELHSAVVKGILVLAGTPTIRPVLKKNRRVLVQALVSKLLEYLQPSCAPCFVEAVQLMWGVGALSDCRHVESMIAERLSSPNAAIRLPAFEAFGNLWRFTEDSQLPGVVLKTPMFMMLDSLKAEDLSTRRAGEAWMRCSLKSYLRILDPLLFTLLDPAIKQDPITVDVAGVQLPLLFYRHKFDQARVHHVLDDLLSLCRFGGQGLIRIAKGSFLKHSLDATFRERVRFSELETHTYLDGLVAILVRFLRAEPAPELVDSLGSLNHHIHSVVAELLQVILSRGEADLAGVKAIEAALTSRLFLSIHRSELDLQNKLLHVLHSVVHTITTNANKRRKGTSPSELPGPHESESGGTDTQLLALSHDEMFVRVVADAVSTQHNNAVIHHWIDFLLMTIPQYRQSLTTVVFPLVDCLVVRIQALVDEFQQTYSGSLGSGPSSEATDAEYTVLMNALERLLLIAIAESGAATLDEEPKQPERVAGDTPASNGPSGLLGYMSGVLGQAEMEPSEVSEETLLRQAALDRVRDSVNLLLFSWEITSALELPAGEENSTSQGYFLGRAKIRARKALERVYKAAPSEVLDDVIAFWDKTRSTAGPESEANIFAMLDILAPSAQTVVSMLCEKLGSKANVSAKQFSASDEIAFAFFEAYLDRVEGPIAVQVWAVTLHFVREFLGSGATSKPFIFPCLRCFTTLSEKVSQTSALEDRRMRRDLQETFIRLADASIQMAGRAVEQGGWLRKAIDANGDTDSILSEKGKPEEDLEDEKRPAPSTSQTNQAHDITEFLGSRVLPDLRRFLIDADKTINVCSNMIYYIVMPAFKTRSKSFEIEPAVFGLLGEMVKNPATVKAWRTPVSDAFGDNRFFNAPPTSHAMWQPLIQSLMASDKERLVELVAKISTVSSANIFTNRELESLSRALSLRRLTYTLLSGENNRFLTQLPIIQEKLVDLLRSSVGDMVHAEVYLCLRVLFCRIGNHHLAGLWPVILTELLRLFESLVDRTVPDGSDLLQLILSACKFLDLTLVLQTEEFQIHEWMFVTDTVDAIYPPDHWLPQAIMDRLGDVLTHSLPTASRPAIARDPAVSEWAAGRARPRSPQLTIKRIDSIQQLEPFFTGVSLAAYDQTYESAGKIDWAAVERALVADLFDGQEAR